MDFAFGRRSVVARIVPGGRLEAPESAAESAEGGQQFERRVEAILDDRRRRRGPSARTSVLFALLAASSLAFAACVHPTTAAIDEPEADIATKAAAYEAMLKNRDAVGNVGKGSAALLITVALDGTGQHKSISAALDAAPAGAVIRVGPGTFDEHVDVTKTVTIEGAGADRTTIVSDAPRPTLHVAGARDFVIRGVTLTQRGAHPEGGVTSCTVVDLADCGARIEKCAIVGGPKSGVVIGARADVTIDGCLVAAVWDTGIFVGAWGEHPPTVRIANCDIRNCRQGGVQVAPGERVVTIEGCRISGSSWHGIRYDNAAPTIRGNLIFENERSGIYASGDTAGLIEGNLFFRNGMSDVSCWVRAKDTIERNTFVDSRREAVAILGASAPVVRRNVFAGCKTAVMAGAITDKVGDSMPYGGGGTIEGNFVWGSGTLFGVRQPRGDGTVDSPLPEGNVVADPGFVDAEHRNYALSETSAARAAGAGVASPLAFASPWPPRPEETATAPSASPAVATASADSAATLARAKGDVLQIDDAAQRERGLAVIGAAIASPDPDVARPALASLFELRDVKYDKRRFRADVVRQLGSRDARVQMAASYAFLQVERAPGDADLVLDAAEKRPAPPGGLLYVAMILSKNRVEGRLADAFVKALAVDDPRRGAMDVANYLRGMWVVPAVEDAVVAAWRRHPGGPRDHGLWPYILGQMQPAPRDSRVRAIFEMLAGGEDDVRQLAGVAVTRPVDDSARPLAAQLAAASLATAATSSLRRTYLDAIRANGGREQVAVLRALAANEMVGDELRSLAGQTADELERR